CFGPAESEGDVSVNGTPVRVTVPKGRAAHAETIDSITIVVVNEDMVDSTFIAGEVCYVGVHSVTADGDAVPMPGSGRAYTVVHAGGEVESVTPPRPKTAGKPQTLEWSCAAALDYAAGESQRFAAIDGPADLASLGTPRGYGWYRATVKFGAPKKARLMLPTASDRFGVYIDGEAAGVIGHGPGAAATQNVSFKRGQHTLVFLAENTGRLSGGTRLGEQTGLLYHPSDSAVLKVPKPAIVEEEAFDPLADKTPVMHVRPGDTTTSGRVRWTISHRRKSSLVVELGPMPSPGIVSINGEVLGLYEEGSSIYEVLDPERLTRGNNTIDFAPMQEFGVADSEEAAPSLAAELHRLLTVTELTAELTAKGEWAYAKWEPPETRAFAAVPKNHDCGGVPAWWRAEFDRPDADRDRPVSLSLLGLTKGQLFLNGENLGRYFAATADGADQPGISSMDIPSSLIRETANELVIFDEHGASPVKCTIGADASRTIIRAVARA
ncbi:MAG: hypothetical protein AAF235_10225, partial [Planctomycetota bacterium]